MDMTGEQLIARPQAEVWAGLNDPAILKACIPGCESVDRVTDNEYRMAMTAVIGPVKAKFNGKLVLADVNPPTSYTLSFEGSGGAAGFGKGTARVALAPDGAGTRLRYQANAQVGGKLAQVGSRLVDGVAKKMANEFFQRFNEQLAGPAPAAPKEERMPVATGPWLTGTWAFIVAFVVTFVLIWLLR